MKVRLSLVGTVPLLMHNARLSDPLDPYTKALKEVSSKRMKTDSDHAEMARVEFLGGLYFDEGVGPYIPSSNLHRCLVEGAKQNKLGRNVERGAIVVEEFLVLGYRGPRTPEELYEDKNFVSRLSVGVTTSRVMRTRPQFRNWALEAELIIDPDQLNFAQVETIAHKAGQMIGLGDYRPRFGRFDVTTELTEE